MFGLKCFQPLPMLPTFYVSSRDHMPKTGFTPLLTQAQTSLLYRALTRGFLGQSMWYDNLPQKLSQRKETRRRWQQTAPYTTRFAAGAAGICVWSAEIQLCHCFWFTQLMAWVALFHSTCSGRCVTSQGQHEGYTSCKYHTLSDLGSTFRWPLGH